MAPLAPMHPLSAVMVPAPPNFGAPAACSAETSEAETVPDCPDERPVLESLTTPDKKNGPRRSPSAEKGNLLDESLGQNAMRSVIGQVNLEDKKQAVDAAIKHIEDAKKKAAELQVQLESHKKMRRPALPRDSPEQEETNKLKRELKEAIAAKDIPSGGSLGQKLTREGQMCPKIKAALKKCKTWEDKRKYRLKWAKKKLKELQKEEYLEKEHLSETDLREGTYLPFRKLWEAEGLDEEGYQALIIVIMTRSKVTTNIVSVFYLCFCLSLHLYVRG